MYDNGDIVQKDGEDVETYFARIEENVFTSMNYGKFNLFIGGDQSIAIPTEKAFLRYCQKINKIPAIIHLDAHPDICDTYEGSKYSHACPNRRSIDNGYKTSDMVLIGMRGYEAQEVEYFAAHPEIEVYNSSYVQNHGIEEMLEHIKNKFDDRYLIYLSYDVDINDPSFAPGTGTPEPFGLDNLTVLKIIKYLVANLPIGALDIVEISPKIDSNDITTWLGLKTLYEVFELLEKK
jgi:agmatinase